MPDTKRLLALADHIETCDHYAGSTLRNANTNTFQMVRYKFECGAPACIGGHACALFKVDRLYKNEGSFEVARRALCLNLDDAAELFEPFIEISFRERSELMEKISPQMAAGVIREFVATGKVNWPLEMPETPTFDH